MSRTTYSDLFTVIGTAFGVGNGTTTFNIPDFRGRFPIAASGETADAFEAQGDTGGAQEHILTVAELAEHDHGYAGYSGGGMTPIMYQTGSTQAFLYNGGMAAPMTTDTAGEDDPHNTLPPFLVLSTAQIKY